MFVELFSSWALQKIVWEACTVASVQVARKSSEGGEGETPALTGVGVLLLAAGKPEVLIK